MTRHLRTSPYRPRDPDGGGGRFEVPTYPPPDDTTNQPPNKAGDPFLGGPGPLPEEPITITPTESGTVGVDDPLPQGPFIPPTQPPVTQPVTQPPVTQPVVDPVSPTEPSTTPTPFIATDNAQGSGFDPDIAEWDVTPEQTVQGQLEQYLSKNNPLFDIMRASARRRAGASGAQNTALAEGMADLAVMNFAFQVAGQDAVTFARSSEFNAAMSNQFEAAEQKFVQNALLSTQNYQQAMMLQAEQIKGQLEGINLSGAWNLKSAQVGASAQIASANIRAAGQIAGIKTAAEYQNWNAQNQFEREWQIYQNSQRSNYVSQMMDNWNQWSINQGGLTPEQFSAANEQWFLTYRGGLDLLNSFSSVPVNPNEDYWGGDYTNWSGGG